MLQGSPAERQSLEVVEVPSDDDIPTGIPLRVEEVAGASRVAEVQPPREPAGPSEVAEVQPPREPAGPSEVADPPRVPAGPSENVADTEPPRVREGPSEASAGRTVAEDDDSEETEDELTVSGSLVDLKVPVARSVL